MSYKDPITLHKVFIHFPIAFITLAFILTVHSLFSRNRTHKEFVYLLYLLSALFSFLAWYTGQTSIESLQHLAPSVQKTVNSHAKWGQATLILSTIAFFTAYLSKKAQGTSRKITNFALVSTSIVLVVSLLLTSILGGKLGHEFGISIEKIAFLEERIDQLSLALAKEKLAYTKIEEQLNKVDFTVSNNIISLRPSKTSLFLLTNITNFLRMDDKENITWHTKEEKIYYPTLPFRHITYLAIFVVQLKGTIGTLFLHKNDILTQIKISEKSLSVYIDSELKFMRDIQYPARITINAQNGILSISSTYIDFVDIEYENIYNIKKVGFIFYKNGEAKIKEISIGGINR